MASLRVREIGLVFLACCLLPAAQAQEPEKVTLCQLKSDPAAFNHKLVEVTAFASHGFEDFTFLDPECAAWPGVWLEYGGKISSGTMYCCGVGPERTRRKQLAVEGVSVPLVVDASFQEFDRLVQRQPDSIVHATLMGRFFSGRQTHLRGGARLAWGGYGHLGCCSLLAIEQIVSVDPQEQDDLDYGASSDTPSLRCGYQDLLPITRYRDLIRDQHEADSGERDWAFDDPERVASEELARLVIVDDSANIKMKQTKTAQGRIVYQWKPHRRRATYMVVVSRPYWLSFYSKDPKRVAWVVIAAYESSCEKGNSVSRMRQERTPDAANAPPFTGDSMMPRIPGGRGSGVS